MLTTFYDKELARPTVEEERIALGRGVSAVVTHLPLEAEGRRNIQHVADLLEQYRPVIESNEKASAAAGWKCPACFLPLKDHEASWNTYVFDLDRPLEGENEPVLMWDSWEPEFHIAATWTPSDGMTFMEWEPDVPMKTCKGCGPRPLEEFGTKNRTPHLDNYCRACRAAQKRARYAADPERMRAAVKAWKKRNPEKVRAARRRYYKENSQRCNATRRRYGQRHPEKVKLWARTAYERTKAKKAQQPPKEREPKAQQPPKEREPRVCIQCGQCETDVPFAGPRTRYCAACAQERIRESNRASRKRYYTTHKKQHAQAVKRWKAAHPEQAREINRRAVRAYYERQRQRQQEG